MNTMQSAIREAGIEHRRTVEIRDTIAETAQRAKSAQMRAVRSGAAISLAERQRRAIAKAHAPREYIAPTYGPQHISNEEPWDRLAEAVIQAWS